MYSFFDQVKEAFKSQRDRNLESLGVNIKGRSRSAEWLQAVCPMCGDSNGSASFSHTGHLKCHQCGRKQDLFQWTGELWGVSDWESCQRLGGSLGVDMKIERAKGGKLPRYLTKHMMRAATMDLWTAEDAEPFRKFLRSRKLDDAQLLEKFGVGFIRGNLVFAQYDYFAGGALRPCYRQYIIIGKKWFWVGTGEKGGFWPYYEVPDDAEIWILEGEWDVMTGWMRLRLQEQGIYCFTWTSTGKIPGHMVPPAWHGKKVKLLYDNDTFQGTHSPRAPTERQLQEQENRFKKLKTHAAGFAANGCDVSLLHIPIDPLENYGADLRDWVDAGNTDITQLPVSGFKDFREREKEAVEVELADVGRYVGKRVKFHAIVESIVNRDRQLPKSTQIDCELGTSNACRSCLVPGKYPQQNIWFPDEPAALANAMMAKNFEHSICSSLLGVPRNCPRVELVHHEYDLACLWHAVRDDEKSQGSTLPVISKDTPTLSGEVEVDGYVYYYRDNNSVVILAKEIRQLDKAKVDLSGHVPELLELCPGEDDDVERIEKYMQSRAADLSYNVTKIHGRPEVHIAHDILMHSSIGYLFNGMEQRGWVDMGMVGSTRTGKTMVFEKLFRWHGIGKIWAAMNGITVAGLTMGAVQGPRGYILKPGLFPRSHKKVLVLDEFHVFDKDREHPIMFLQSARDLGHCDSIKISGSRSLPSKVRFCTISNWPKARGAGRFPCQQFLNLYRKPEALSRCDFILVVDDDPEPEVPTESRWTVELARALILRAWAMDPEMVDFDPEAHEAAREFVDECRGVFSEKIPLFTPEASFYSILRLAVAVANLCFSFQEGNHYACRVKRGHVLVVCNWLRRTWELSKYDLYSENEVRRNEVLDPYKAEQWLTTKLKLESPREVGGVLETLLGGFRESDIVNALGCESYEAAKWLAPMLRNNVFAKDDERESYFITYSPTRGGEQIIRNLIDIAEGYPDLFNSRVNKLKAMLDGGLKPSIPSLDKPLHYIIGKQDRQSGSGRDQEADEISF